MTSRTLVVNPTLKVTLVMSMRVRHHGVREMLVKARREPELAAWLVGLMPDPSAANQGIAELDDETRKNLEELGVLVSDPPAAVFLGELSGAPIEQCDKDAGELSEADYVLTAPAQPIPAQLADLVGAPPLDPEKAHAWVSDPATQIVLPVSLSKAEHEAALVLKQSGLAALVPKQRALLQAKGILWPHTAQAARMAAWAETWQRARVSLRGDRYAVLPRLLDGITRIALRDYVRALQREGCFPARDDGGVAGRHGIYDELGAGALHAQLAASFGRLLGEPLEPSYRYLAVYNAGGVLPKHVDREQCAWNCSFVVDMESVHGEPEPWPLFLEVRGEPVAVQLDVGDGVLYPGTEMPHWRDALPQGRKMVACFFHFVRAGFEGSRA